MPVRIIRGNITKLSADAIVNAANSSLLGGGGVDGAIHHAAGPGLLAECRTIGGCPTGQARITGGYDLPCRYVIHTVGPVWKGGSAGEPELLASCYRESLRLAEEHGCRTIAFPLISAGIYGYPKTEAMSVALGTIRDYLSESSSDMSVTLVVLDRDFPAIDSRLRSEISLYIHDHLIDAKARIFKASANAQKMEPPHFCAPSAPPACESAAASDESCDSEPMFSEASFVCDNAAIPESSSLSERLSHLDESFSQTLLRLIDRSGMTDVQCYKRANIDRKLFSKIRSDVNYRPSKSTVLAFAIALELDPEQTRELLRKAGFALSRSNKFDIIVEYFIERGTYDLMLINEALFSFDQPLLGA